MWDGEMRKLFLIERAFDGEACPRHSLADHRLSTLLVPRESVDDRRALGTDGINARLSDTAGNACPRVGRPRLGGIAPHGLLKLGLNRAPRLVGSAVRGRRRARRTRCC